MTTPTLLEEVLKMKHESEVYPYLYGYLRAWIVDEAKRTNNGQISAAEARAVVKYLEEVKEMAIAGFDVRHRDQIPLI